MKKKMPKPRNPMVLALRNCKSSIHEKPYKTLRKKEKDKLKKQIINDY